MATLPRATVRVEPTAAAPGSGLDTVCILAAVPSNPDMTPRIFGGAQAIYEQHGYSEGVEYGALHLAYTGKSVIFVGMPIGTAGVISRFTSHENTGSSVVTVVAGADGVLSDHRGVLRVVAGGTIGTDQIKLELSLDDGRSFSPLRLGTANSYTLPYVGATANFAAGTLVTGDTIAEWHGSGPRIDTGDLAEVFDNLAADLKQFRSIMILGDLPNDTAAAAVLTQVNAYATEHQRFVYARASVPDRLPQASLSQAYARFTGAAALTFDAATDTVERSSGSWLADGFRDGDSVTFVDTVGNDGTFVVTTVTADTLTFGNVITDEVISSGFAVTGGPTLVFAASGDTITRNRGSWLADGFRAGDDVAIDGTASNEVTLAAQTVTALVLTLANGLSDETLPSDGVTVTSNLTKAAWMAEQDAEFAAIDGESRLDLGAGRGAVISPFSGWDYRRPVSWAASAIEYQHDVHVATWRKELGPSGFDLFDANGLLSEWDDRVDGGAGSAARFTTFRTWPNGPRGAFITQSLTRAGDGQLTSQTHNMAVVNVGLTTVQRATEQVIGRSLQLNADGTATADSLAVIASEVNAAVELALLTSRGEGPRASRAVWFPDPEDVYNVPEPVMHGTLELLLNGTIHSVDTAVRLSSNGQ